MDNLTAAILTLVIVSPSIVVLAVIIWRQLLEFWLRMQPVRSRALTLARRLSSFAIPLPKYLYASWQNPPKAPTCGRRSSQSYRTPDQDEQSFPLHRGKAL